MHEAGEGDAIDVHAHRTRALRVCLQQACCGNACAPPPPAPRPPVPNPRRLFAFAFQAKCKALAAKPKRRQGRLTGIEMSKLPAPAKPGTCVKGAVPQEEIEVCV